MAFTCRTCLRFARSKSLFLPLSRLQIQCGSTGNDSGVGAKRSDDSERELRDEATVSRTKCCRQSRKTLRLHVAGAVLFRLHAAGTV
ncbi:hypothetical protein TGRH88_059030 [Toxoplasma gondii]|uniref:Uncharacterized protein n=1 Tax=Toxoplasma gondii TaxID=5811 RepID=A0A7J6JVH4_TOXGO|nr:hypothetical protein TGRH88_059030 [Toxoplasma gondii]